MPLRHHFEQNFHVAHRLDRYGAGRRLDYDDLTPEVLAEAIAAEIGREVDLPPGGDRRRRARRGPARRPAVSRPGRTPSRDHTRSDPHGVGSMVIMRRSHHLGHRAQGGVGEPPSDW